MFFPNVFYLKERYIYIRNNLLAFDFFLLDNVEQFYKFTCRLTYQASKVEILLKFFPNLHFLLPI